MPRLLDQPWANALYSKISPFTVGIDIGPLSTFITARFWELKLACGRNNCRQMVGTTMLSSTLPWDHWMEPTIIDI